MNYAHKDGNRNPLAAHSIDTSVIPICDDPNNYCQLCSKTYSTKGNYHRHIKDTHRDVLQEAIPLSTLTNSTNPANVTIKQKKMTSMFYYHSCQIGIWVTSTTIL